jgi:predicted nuclease of restriction endonuclease-like (RecB) superfamily
MLMNDKNYVEILDAIKRKIGEAQRNAFVSVNKELINLYLSIGKAISEKSTWGNKFVDNLSRDISLEFPNMKGFSRRNLLYMAKFYKEYQDNRIVQTLSAQISWSHNTYLLDNIKDKNVRIWYMQETIKAGWSYRVLIHQIENDLYKRQIATNKVDNFKVLLPSPQSELVKQATKDPYIFDFVANGDEIHERQLENALVDNVAKLLLELGRGFAFIGEQYHLEVGNKDFYIDLLFFNLELNCYVVVELKNTEFQPEYAGKLNFYLSAVDDILKKEHHNPTIGLLLCKGKDNLIAEYALKNMTKPMGVSSYKLIEKLPKKFENILPSAEDFKTRIKFE